MRRRFALRISAKNSFNYFTINKIANNKKGNAKEGKNEITFLPYVGGYKWATSGFQPEEILPRVLDSTDFQAYVPLYENQLSAAYLLTK